MVRIYRGSAGNVNTFYVVCTEGQFLEPRAQDVRFTLTPLNVNSSLLVFTMESPGTFAGARALRRIGTSTMRLNTVNLTFTVAELETAFNHRNRGGNANQWKVAVLYVLTYLHQRLITTAEFVLQFVAHIPHDAVEFFDTNPDLRFFDNLVPNNHNLVWNDLDIVLPDDLLLDVDQEVAIDVQPHDEAGLAPIDLDPWLAWLAANER